MANALYPLTKQKFLLGSINMMLDTIKIVLVDTADYTFMPTDEFLSSVASAARVKVSDALTNKTVINGVFDADDVTLTTVTGDVSEALIIFKDTGDAATSPLIAYIDTATGLPITPNGGNIIIQWDSGANKIFAL